MLVVDHFHLVKLANDVLIAVRRRVTFDAHGRRGRKQDPEWPTDADRSPRENDCLQSIRGDVEHLVDNDPSAQIPAAYIAKEELRQLLSAAADRGR